MLGVPRVFILVAVPQELSGSFANRKTLLSITQEGFWYGGCDLLVAIGSYYNLCSLARGNRGTAIATLGSASCSALVQLGSDHATQPPLTQDGGRDTIATKDQS